MIDFETAQQKVLAHINTLVVPKEGDELAAVLTHETQTEWVFSWNSKRYVETRDIHYALVGTLPIAVSKVDGVLSFPPSPWLNL